MNTRKHIAAEKKRCNSHNCAQAILHTYADIAGIDEELAMNIANSFGAGMGNMEGTCGAIVGATFYGKVEGDSMIEAGINDGDIAVIDRSVEAQRGDIVVGYINDEFTIKYLDLRHRKDGYIELRPANKDFKPIRIDADDDFEVWGVVIWTIKRWK